jgi:hypothetical protein
VGANGKKIDRVYYLEIEKFGDMSKEFKREVKSDIIKMTQHIGRYALCGVCPHLPGL